jgi:hypothetical protein
MLPDFEAYAMKPDRLRNHTRCEVHGIRRLRRGNTLTTSIALTAAGIFTQAAPQRTVRQSSLAQALSDGKCRRAVVHVSAPRATPQSGRQAARSPCAFPTKRATCIRTPTHAKLPPGCRRPRHGPQPPRHLPWPKRRFSGKCSNVAAKPVVCARLVAFRLVCVGRDVPTGAPLRPVRNRHTLFSGRKLSDTKGISHKAAAP